MVAVLATHRVRDTGICQRLAVANGYVLLAFNESSQRLEIRDDCQMERRNFCSYNE